MTNQTQPTPKLQTYATASSARALSQSSLTLEVSTLAISEPPGNSVSSDVATPEKNITTAEGYYIQKLFKVTNPQYLIGN